MKPVVAVVGRPNVGKSALFNRIIQRRVAIVEDVAGVTRDRIAADTEWNGKSFTVVDTGGLLTDSADEMTAQIRRQVEAALSEADLVLLVVDARDGVVPADREVAAVIRRSGCPALLVVNKAEDMPPGIAEGEASELGFDDPVAVSATHGVGIGDLLDRIVEMLPGGGPAEEEAARIKVAVVGRPNVGKSSLLNRILGEARMVVSSEPGTTRDAVDVPLDLGDKRFLMIDTAGIRRWGRVEKALEKYSITRSFRAVDRCDVAVLVMSAADGMTDQDRKIAGRVNERGKALVLCFNKCDLIEGPVSKARQEFTRLARWQMGFVSYAPLVFTSAKDGTGVSGVMERVASAAAEHAKRVPTGELNRVLRDAFMLAPPPSEKGKSLKLFYATQASVRPPVFVLFVSRPEIVRDPYIRYLDGRVRESFGFEGTPLVFRFRRNE